MTGANRGRRTHVNRGRLSSGRGYRVTSPMTSGDGSIGGPAA
jgi:hypothetical protein